MYNKRKEKKMIKCADGHIGVLMTLSVSGSGTGGVETNFTEIPHLSPATGNPPHNGRGLGQVDQRPGPGSGAINVSWFN